jgi:PAS domain S-box-containing protein
MYARLAASTREIPAGPALFQRMVEVCPFGVLVMGDDERFVDANPAACRLFGVRYDQLLGQRVDDFVDPAEIVPIRDLWSDFRRHRTLSGEFPLVRADGRRRVLRYHAVADFAPGLHVSFLEDVTDVRAAQQALAVSEKRFRLLADGLPLIIWMGDPRGKALYYNRHWYEYTGLAPPAEGDRDLHDFNVRIHPDDVERVWPVVRDRRERGLDLEVTYRLRRHDGVYRWHLARSLPIRDESGQVICRVGASTDIEDQRRAIEDLQLERELRERFVAALSHDLRSPLHAVNMSAQLLLRWSGQPERVQTQAARIIRNVTHADQMIQNLLDASRISAGEGMHIQRTPGDLQILVREVLDDLTTIHGDRFELVAEGPLPCTCDWPAMRRTLENLVGNAIKYGNPHTRVRVALCPEGDHLALSVHNLGNPIPEDEQGKIFQPYHRARPQSATGPLGWGLGLTLVRGIAEAHGGTARVQSSAEAGTTFTVTLRRE